MFWKHFYSFFINFVKLNILICIGFLFWKNLFIKYKTIKISNFFIEILKKKNTGNSCKKLKYIAEIGLLSCLFSIYEGFKKSVQI